MFAGHLLREEGAALPGPQGNMQPCCVRGVKSLPVKRLAVNRWPTAWRRIFPR